MSSSIVSVYAKPRVSSVQRIKPDDTTPELPVKRLSDSVLAMRLPSDMNDDDYPPAKRIKSDNFMAKVPLSPVNRDIVAPPSVVSPMSIVHASPVNNDVDVDEVRAKMLDIQRLITALEPGFYRLQAKKNPTKADNTRLANYSQRLAELRRQKDLLKAQIPAALPSRPPSFTTHLPAVAPQAPMLPQVPYLEPTMPGAFPFMGYASPQMGASQTYAAPSGSPFFPKSEPTQTTLDAHLRTGHVPLYDDNEDQDQPVASGSSAPQILARGKLPELDSDSDEDGVPNVFLNRIVPNIPIMAPLQNAGDYNDDGDWHGRGRDNFRGPVAKADE